ncbi:MAG: CapA family protein [Gammaproteobacteria bacterium]|jgi:poly-gamma-glutamate capsule biosynthesis protein CapA/YwtB (metallophosphatase superfamily)
MNEPAPDTDVTVCLTGDLMTGRGIDQILPHPSGPRIQEPYIKDARDYVALAEELNGPIEAPVGWEYIWSDALALLQSADASVVNLETSVTTSEHYWRGKDIHYRMHPGNVPCLTAAGIDCCVLANNHVMDWGYEGLEETLVTLGRAGIQTAGAGREVGAAQAPAILPLPGARRLLVFAYGDTSSGIPPRWAADEDRAGVSLLKDLSRTTADRVTANVTHHRRPDDVVVVSLHWGPNWGYAIPDVRAHFAHALMDSGLIDVVHGHSSHHPVGIERHARGLILYGCGDLLNDYEGIRGHESFRGDLTLLYRVTLPGDGSEPTLRMTPLKVRRMRLNRAGREDAEWLAAALDRASARLGTRVSLRDNDEITA